MKTLTDRRQERPRGKRLSGSVSPPFEKAGTNRHLRATLAASLLKNLFPLLQQLEFLFAIGFKLVVVLRDMRDQFGHIGRRMQAGYINEICATLVELDR